MEALRAIDKEDQIVSPVVLEQGTEGTVSTYAGGTKQVFSENRANSAERIPPSREGLSAIFPRNQAQTTDWHHQQE